MPRPIASFMALRLAAHRLVGDPSPNHRPARAPAILLALVAALAGACTDAERNGAGEVQTAGDLSVYELRAGDCFNGGQRVAEEVGKERTVKQVTAVPCDQAHDNEVFAVFEHPAPADAAFPGEEAVNKVAQDGCLERFEPYVGRPYAGSDLRVAVIAPGETSWKEEHDRAIACIVYGEESLKGSRHGIGTTTTSTTTQTTVSR